MSASRQARTGRLERVVLQDGAHAAALLTLLDHYAQDPMGGGEPLSPYAQAHLIEALRARAGYVGFLAYLDQRPVALANCFEGFSTFAAKPLLNVHDLVVHRDVRGAGLGQLLLAGVEAEARRRGCCKLTLEVLSGNSRALRSYVSFGFAPYQLDPNAGQALLLQKALV